MVMVVMPMMVERSHYRMILGYPTLLRQLLFARQKRREPKKI